MSQPKITKNTRVACGTQAFPRSRPRTDGARRRKSCSIPLQATVGAPCQSEVSSVDFVPFEEGGIATYGLSYLATIDSTHRSARSQSRAPSFHHRRRCPVPLRRTTPGRAKTPRRPPLPQPFRSVRGACDSSRRERFWPVPLPRAAPFLEWECPSDRESPRSRAHLFLAIRCPRCGQRQSLHPCWLRKHCTMARRW